MGDNGKIAVRVPGDKSSGELITEEAFRMDYSSGEYDINEEFESFQVWLNASVDAMSGTGMQFGYRVKGSLDYVAGCRSCRQI